MESFPEEVTSHQCPPPVPPVVCERAEPVAVCTAEGQHQQHRPARLLPPWSLPWGQVELLPPEGQDRWDGDQGLMALHLSPTSPWSPSSLAWQGATWAPVGTHLRPARPRRRSGQKGSCDQVVWEMPLVVCDACGYLRGPGGGLKMS